MIADDTGVSRSAAEVRPAATRRTLPISSRFAVELAPNAIVSRATTAAGSGFAGSSVPGARSHSMASRIGPRETRFAMVMSVPSSAYRRPQRRARTMYRPNMTAAAPPIAMPSRFAPFGSKPARSAVPRIASTNPARAAGRTRSPRTGTANRAAATAYSGEMKPVTVDPLSATARLTAAMNPRPPIVARMPRRTRLSRFAAARVGRGISPRRRSAATNGSAIVQASPAIASGVNERSAIPVAG